MSLQNASKPRLSNIELLRIIAMLLVIVVHCNFFSLGAPTHKEALAEPLPSFVRFFIQSFSVLCVNVFVLISGWFGIRPKIKSVAGFIFQCLFFWVGIYLALLALGEVALTRKGIAECLLCSQANWFALSYLGLCVVAPLINTYIEQSSERELRTILFWFFLFQTIYGWVNNAASFFVNGYSTMSFIGLYMLARYVRLYPNRFTTRSRFFDLFIFGCIVLFDAMASYLSFRMINFRADVWLFSYISPLIIISALYLLLLFSKIQIQSKWINWVAASCFSAYLLHQSPNIAKPYFVSTVQLIYKDFSGFEVLVVMSLFVIAIFAVSVVLDQVRKVCWSCLLYVARVRK